MENNGTNKIFEVQNRHWDTTYIKKRIFVILYPTHIVWHTALSVESIKNFWNKYIGVAWPQLKLDKYCNNVNKTDDLHILLCVQCTLSLTQYIHTAYKMQQKICTNYGENLNLMNDERWTSPYTIVSTKKIHLPNTFKTIFATIWICANIGWWRWNEIWAIYADGYWNESTRLVLKMNLLRMRIFVIY